MLRARLGLVHVLDVPPLNFWARVEDRMKEDIRAQAEALLTDVSQRIARACHLTPTFYIVEGPPDVEVCRLAQEQPDVLMVIAGRYGMASERRSRLPQALSGDLARRLVSQLPVPFLVIPPDIDDQHICPNLGLLVDGLVPQGGGENSNEDPQQTP
jgi:nucleotide-binding universal stress UspA family protein